MSVINIYILISRYYGLSKLYFPNIIFWQIIRFWLASWPIFGRDDHLHWQCPVSTAKPCWASRISVCLDGSVSLLKMDSSSEILWRCDVPSIADGHLYTAEVNRFINTNPWKLWESSLCSGWCFTLGGKHQFTTTEVRPCSGVKGHAFDLGWHLTFVDLSP